MTYNYPEWRNEHLGLTDEQTKAIKAYVGEIVGVEPEKIESIQLTKYWYTSEDIQEEAEVIFSRLETLSEKEEREKSDAEEDAYYYKQYLKLKERFEKEDN